MKKLIISKTNIFFTGIILIPIIVFGVVHQMERKERLPVYNQANGLESAEYIFQDQYGQIKTFKTLKGKIILIDFFFTSCPVICPKMTNGLRMVAQKFQRDPSLQFLSFSVDPSRDSSSKLLKYANKMHANFPAWSFLTGDKKSIYKLARKEFFVTATEGDGGPEDFIHTDKIILVDTNKKIRGYYDGTNITEIYQLIKDIKKLEDES